MPLCSFPCTWACPLNMANAQGLPPGLGQGEARREPAASSGGPQLRRPTGAGLVLKGGASCRLVSQAPGLSLPSDSISPGTLAQAAPSAHLPHEWGSIRASPQPQTSVFTFLLDVSTWMPLPPAPPQRATCVLVQGGEETDLPGTGELSRTRQRAWDSCSGGWTASPME